MDQYKTLDVAYQFSARYCISLLFFYNLSPHSDCIRQPDFHYTMVIGDSEVLNRPRSSGAVG